MNELSGGDWAIGGESQRGQSLSREQIESCWAPATAERKAKTTGPDEGSIIPTTYGLAKANLSGRYLRQQHSYEILHVARYRQLAMHKGMLAHDVMPTWHLQRT